jgi:hypothetical protein
VISIIRKTAAPVIVGVALGGCTATAPMQQYPMTWNAPGSYYAPPRYYAPPPNYPALVQPGPVSPPLSARLASPPVNDPPPPLRPVDPDPPAPRFLPPVTLLSPPADATDCTGWWRICHFY